MDHFSRLMSHRLQTRPLLKVPDSGQFGMWKKVRTKLEFDAARGLKC